MSDRIEVPILGATKKQMAYEKVILFLNEELLSVDPRVE